MTILPSLLSDDAEPESGEGGAATTEPISASGRAASNPKKSNKGSRGVKGAKTQKRTMIKQPEIEL